MSVFDGYARYYNLLYRDKDYKGEAQHVHQIIKKHHPYASRLMELGCGTGRHAAYLAQMGYRVYGVDQSRSMLGQAIQYADSLPPTVGSLLQFSQGDIRHVRTRKRFDAVVALFHVISYMSDAKDLDAAFATASYHLRQGGIMVFDVWYGPAVLTNQPLIRIKRMRDDHTEVWRIAEPLLHVNDNLVEVNYEILIRDRQTRQTKVIKEIHRMRYIFKPEVERLFSVCGLQLLDFFEWMTGAPPGTDTWGVCFVGRK
jgi:SAM-dependent methyltransferase